MSRSEIAFSERRAILRLRSSPAQVRGRALAISILNEAYPDMSQREVAERMGVDRSTIGRTMSRTGMSWQRSRHRVSSFTTRNTALVAEAIETGRSLAAIGLDYGITRERVRQILEGAGVEKRRAVRKNHYSRCSACGKARRAYEEGRCWDCYRAILVTLPCGWCGAPVTRTLARARSHMKRTGKDTTTFYCNRTCLGRWFGHTHGIKPGGPGRRHGGASQSRSLSRQTPS